MRSWGRITAAATTGPTKGPRPDALEVEDLDQLFTQEAQIIIYRIFQECLTNISKHAQASEVAVTVQAKDGALSLVIEDNGRGFDPGAVLGREATGRGLGLAALDERSQVYGDAPSLAGVFKRHYRH